MRNDRWKCGFAALPWTANEPCVIAETEWATGKTACQTKRGINMCAPRLHAREREYSVDGETVSCTLADSKSVLVDSSHE